MPVVDFHSHILPHMDDGAKNTDMSLAMLSEMGAQGIDVVLATSHFYARKESINSFVKRRNAAFEHLKSRINEVNSICPEIIPGAEVAFYFGMSDDENIEKLCVENTNTMLVEMPFSRWTGYELDTLSSLCFDHDLNIVLAHLERFSEYNVGNEIYDKILELPVKVQINAGTLLSFFGRKKWLDMFKDKDAQILGSDAHNMDSRSPNLQKGREIIRKKLGGGVLSEIDRISSTLINR